MASPKTVGQFYVENTRKTAKSAASAQDAATRYLDEATGITRAYYDAWSGVQNASLQTAFQLQNTLIQATQSIMDATAQASLLMFDEWARAVAGGQEAMAGMVMAGTNYVERSMPGSRE